MICAWPDQQHLNELRDLDADVLVVIGWGETETAAWIEDARPLQLLPGQTLQAASEPDSGVTPDPLPNGVGEILEHLAAWAAGYDSGSKWIEEVELKADMMNCPDRWEPVTVEQVRAKCRDLKMRPNDVETIAGFPAPRKQGHRLNVRSSYRDLRFA